MRLIILSLILLGLFSCTKDNTQSLQGKWKLRGVFDCTGGSEINDNSLAIEFQKNGVFVTSSSYPNFLLWYESNGVNKYFVRNDSILIYKINSNDTTFYHYRLEDELILNFGYGGYRFSR